MFGRSYGRCLISGSAAVLGCSFRACEICARLHPITVVRKRALRCDRRVSMEPACASWKVHCTRSSMSKQQQRQFRHLLLLCMLVSPSGLLAQADAGAPLGAEAAAAAAMGAKPASARLGETIREAFTADSYQQAVDSFTEMMRNAYNMNGLFGVDPAQLKQMDLPEQYLQAAERMRSTFRQGLAELTQGTLLQNASLASSMGLGDMARGLGIGNGSIAESIMRSAVPITLAQDGQPQLPLLNAVGTWLGQQVQQAMKSESQPGGRLAGLLNIATPSGRKLQQLEYTPLDAAADNEVTLDAVAAAARDIERIRTYVADLAGLANEVLEFAGPEEEEAYDGEEADEEWEDVDDDDVAAEASHKRKLAQTFTATPNGPNPFTGIANAFRFIFSNTFDWFRARGLYGLVPVIADIRGLLARYNWIGDLLLIVATPVENFVNANFFPLPQTNDDFTALVRRFFADYCTYEEVTSSAQLLGGFVGPTFSVQLEPVSCPIYADPVTGRSYVSFADCDPAQLVIRTTPLLVTEAYLSAAEYVGAECKYTEVYGVDTNLNLGGGAQEFTFRRSAQGIDIVPTLIQINPDLRFLPYLGDEAPVDPGTGIQLTAANNVTRTPAVTITNPSITLAAVNAAGDK